MAASRSRHGRGAAREDGRRGFGGAEDDEDAEDWGSGSGRRSGSTKLRIAEGIRQTGGGGNKSGSKEESRRRRSHKSEIVDLRIEGTRGNHAAASAATAPSKSEGELGVDGKSVHSPVGGGEEGADEHVPWSELDERRMDTLRELFASRLSLKEIRSAYLKNSRNVETTVEMLLLQPDHYSKDDSESRLNEIDSQTGDNVLPNLNPNSKLAIEASNSTESLYNELDLWSTLPEECKAMILSQLDFKDVSRMAAINREFARIVKDRKNDIHTFNLPSNLSSFAYCNLVYGLSNLSTLSCKRIGKQNVKYSYLFLSLAGYMPSSITSENFLSYCKRISNPFDIVQDASFRNTSLSFYMDIFWSLYSLRNSYFVLELENLHQHVCQKLLSSDDVLFNRPFPFRSLVSVDLRNCQYLTDFDVEALCDFHYNLREVNTSGCPLLSDRSMYAFSFFGKRSKLPHVLYDHRQYLFNNIHDLENASLNENMDKKSIPNDSHDDKDRRIKSVTMCGCNINNDCIRDILKENQFDYLDVSKCTNLTHEAFAFSFSSRLRVLKTTNLPHISKIHFFFSYDSPLSEVNLSHCALLKEATFIIPNLKSLYLGGCKSLTTLKLHSVSLTNLNLSNCISLANVSEINSSQLTQLNLFMCRSIPIGTLSQIFQNGKILEEINCGGCIGNLEILNLEGDDLRTIKASGCTSLVRVSIRSTKLKEIDFSGCEQLHDLSILSSSLTHISLSNCKSLSYLRIPFIDIKAKKSQRSSLPSNQKISKDSDGIHININGCLNLPDVSRTQLKILSKLI